MPREVKVILLIGTLLAIITARYIVPKETPKLKYSVGHNGQNMNFEQTDKYTIDGPCIHFKENNIKETVFCDNITVFEN